MTDQYAVVGNPVAHSKSPLIHTAFAAATGQDLSYTRLEAPLDGFAATVQTFFAEGGKGLNITVPFKEEAWALAAVRSPRAEKAGAVNTLLMGKDGRLYGDNTDGVGLLRDLEQNQGLQLRGARILVLGAGGAVRGVLGPLLEAAPTALVLSNRTSAKAEVLRELFAAEGTITVCTQDALAGQQFDVVVNGTSASLSNSRLELPPDLLAPGALAYDMVYGKDTPFLQWARQQGARTADGLGMLVEQAAEAFFLWRMQRPATAPVMQQMRIS